MNPTLIAFISHSKWVFYKFKTLFFTVAVFSLGALFTHWL